MINEQLNITELAGQPYVEKQVAFINAYTGIGPSQFELLDPTSARKVFFGLHKQLDLAASLHGPQTKGALYGAIHNYFEAPQGDLEQLAQHVNSLVVFGDVRPLEGSGVEYLHERSAHFWHILGWEQLQQVCGIESNTKLAAGSIAEIERNSGNLVRTLDLLAERWGEHHVGPHLIYPIEQQLVSKENKLGYSYVKLKSPYSNTLAVVSSANEVIPTEHDKQMFAEQANMLRRLLDRYPMELAYAIYDYYAFSQGLDVQNLNVTLVQEYTLNGEKRVKGIMNGQTTILLGGREIEGFTQEVIVASNGNSVVGAPTSSDFVMFDVPVTDDHIITIVSGRPAQALAESPQDTQQLSVKPKKGQLREQIIKYAKSKDSHRKGVPAAKQDKPIISLLMSEGVQEYHPVEITPEMLDEASEQISQFATQHGVQFINLEAGHIHADTTPTGRQKKGMRIGAHIAHGLEEQGMQVRKTTMIDEDHVPNALDHKAYVDLMQEQGLQVDEVLYESSPAIREIAVAAISSLQQQYPEQIYMEGTTMMFNIPGTALQVELIKDVTRPIVELGCVIFDVGLTLVKIYPKLAETYMPEGSAQVHQQMLEIYKQYSGQAERFAAVKAAFPEKSRTYEDIMQAQPLPDIEDKHAGIVNVLEGFYAAQQVKLQGMLRALNIPIHLIDVTFSDRGLHISLPQ